MDNLAERSSFVGRILALENAILVPVLMMILDSLKASVILSAEKFERAVDTHVNRNATRPILVTQVTTA